MSLHDNEHSVVPWVTVSELIRALQDRAPNAKVFHLAPGHDGARMQPIRHIDTVQVGDELEVHLW